MDGGTSRALKVFLCHASGDKQQVRALYKRMIAEGVDAWLDQEKLLPGQDWRVEIPRAVQDADVVVVCLSNKSITKEGYIQKEIRFALDAADEKPDGTIFLIPARLEDCPVPEKLSRWHWVDLFEDNGYVKLLRSLELRAARAGAVIVPSGYVDEDEERDQRLEQYYTEGLAAFYTEDWDKACQRFQLILRENPNHVNALEKLEEAEYQRDLGKLYKQAADAYQAEDWQDAIRALEELLKKSPEYRDSARLFQNARKQKQLIDLNSEAKRLHAAGKWQAVLKVFDQVFAIEPDYPDTDGLFTSAKKEVAELERLAGLNNLYSRALREMEAQKWRDARVLLEQIHKEQTGFLETERLLKKVEGEITKEDDIKRRKDQIVTLYEQAHGLFRSENWRKALEKIDEIRKLDSQFEDNDGLTEKIRSALETEEREAQKQNQLAAMYAEAVRLLKEGKYQESLEKWDEIKAIYPKYPDRQQIQKNARKKLTALDTYKKNYFFDKSRIIFGWLLGTFLLVGLTYIIVINIPVKLFSEDFEDGKAQEVTNAAENWRIIPDETGNNVYDVNNSISSGYPGIDFGSIDWTDYKIEFRMRFLNTLNPQAIIEFRRNRSAYSKYVVSVGRQNVNLHYTTPGTGWNLIKYAPYNIDQNEWYRFRIQAQGSEIKVYVNNVLVHQIEDTRYSSGSINIQVGPYTRAQFDDIKVTSLEK
jgi:outer membrane protein assembly factor BamD (BamD/ComL family)